MIDLSPWLVAPGEPLSATDGEIAAALGVTERQVGYARRRAGYPSWGRGRPSVDARARARVLRRLATAPPEGVAEAVTELNIAQDALRRALLSLRALGG